MNNFSSKETYSSEVYSDTGFDEETLHEYETPLHQSNKNGIQIKVIGGQQQAATSSLVAGTTPHSQYSDRVKRKFVCVITQSLAENIRYRVQC